MNSRFARLIGSLSLIITGTMVTNWGTASAGIPDTGKITLATPVGIFDSRIPDHRLAANQDQGIPGTGLLDITIVDAHDEGVAAVHPCGAPITGDDILIHFEAEQTVVRKVQLSNGASWCVLPTQSVHMLFSSHGSISSTATAGGLQFRSILNGNVVLDSVVGFPTTQRNTMPISAGGFVPGSAEGVVYRVEAVDSQIRGYLSISPCSAPESMTADLVFEERPTSNIVYVPTPTPGASLCMTLHGGSVAIRLTVLGWLDDTGPDGDSLPPVETDEVHGVDAPGFVAIPPQRVLDTRNAVGVDQAAPIAADDVLALDLFDVTTDSTTAVVLNVTVTQPRTGGYLTVWPCDEDMPVASNLNFTAGQTVPNLVNVRLSTDALVCFSGTADLDLIADLAGTFELGGGFASQSVTPFRLLDTRNGIGATAGTVGANQPLILQVAGRGGAPGGGGTDAATINLTVTQPRSGGYLTAWPCDAPQPTASNLNFTADQTVPNLVTVKVSAAGTVCLLSTAPTHLIADLQAWYGPSATNGYVDLTPARLLDTRTGIGAPPGKQPANTPLHLTVAGHEGVPDTGADSVTMNVTITQPDGPGYLTVWPCDQPMPTASNLNFDPGQTVPNLVTVKVASDGTVCLSSTAVTHVLADVAGYSTADQLLFWSTSLVDP